MLWDLVLCFFKDIIFSYVRTEGNFSYCIYITFIYGSTPSGNLPLSREANTEVTKTAIRRLAAKESIP